MNTEKYLHTGDHIGVIGAKSGEGGDGDMSRVSRRRSRGLSIGRRGGGGEWRGPRLLTRNVEARAARTSAAAS